MKARTLFALLVAVGCGLAAAVLVKNAYPKPEPAPAPEERIEVLVAKEPGIDAYTYFDKEEDRQRFETVSMPRELVSADAIGPADFERKVTRRTLKRGLGPRKYLAESDLIDAPPDIAWKLKDGERAQALKTNMDLGGGGFIRPEDHVDIIATVTQTRDGQLPYAETILQDIEVLAVNTELQAREGQVNTKSLDRVILRLKPEQVQTLALHEKIGEIKMSKRRPNETGTVALARTTVGRKVATEQPEGILFIDGAGPTLRQPPKKGSWVKPQPEPSER